MLTKEYLHSLFDYQDGQLVRTVNVSRMGKAGDIAGHFDPKLGYYRIRINSVSYLLHRIIFLYQHGYLPEYVDHINGNPKDNRIENLRPATKIENCRNKAIHKNNSSGFKNVAWKKGNEKWSVTISVEKKKRHIGYFRDLELADLVAIEARNLYHGQYARHF